MQPQLVAFKASCGQWRVDGRESRRADIWAWESGNYVMLIDTGGDGGNSYPANLTSVNVWH